jgi:hypothetical protein
MAEGTPVTLNPKVWWSLLGPAFRGLVLKTAKKHDDTPVRAHHEAHFNWRYERDQPELARLYAAAKTSQWDADDLEWGIEVDPHDEAHELISEDLLAFPRIPQYRSLDKKSQEKQRLAMLSWILSQILHGEQGALLAACQVTESVPWIDGKLYGSTQVVDEGRHVEVFHRYLTEKLEKSYRINDNLYVIIDALAGDKRWDIKFLGMQILIEGLALGSFQAIRHATKEPLLRELLRRVITDEARHVHYGVIALESYYVDELSPSERREREDWAYEISVLLRNRFLAHEFYDEHYAHAMKRKEWDALVDSTGLMDNFRRSMFKRLIPNLKRIGLLSDRIRPHYEAIGVLGWETEKAAPELATDELF